MSVGITILIAIISFCGCSCADTESKGGGVNAISVDRQLISNLWYIKIQLILLKGNPGLAATMFVFVFAAILN